MVNVEIDDRDALGIIAGARVMRGDGGLIEEAEAHGAAGFGMVAGRAQRAEDIVGLAPEHRIDAGGCSTDAAQRRLERARRHDRIGVEIFEAFGRRHGANPLQMLVGMGAQNVLVAASGASRRTRSLKCSDPRIWLTALMRSIRSGWPWGVRWRSEDGWVNSSVVMAPF